MKKIVLFFAFILFSVGVMAQQKIINFSQTPDRAKQTIEQYIETHSVSEMDGDTITLANIYGLIGYSYTDKYLGVLSGNFISVGQDFEYLDTTIESKKQLLYILNSGEYQEIPKNKEAIKKKLNSEFVLNGDDSFFYRNDTFVVKADYYLGKKDVKLHCISYAKKYKIDFKD